MKPNWNHWVKLADVTGILPSRPKLVTKTSYMKAEELKKMLRKVGKDKGLTFKSEKGRYAFFNRKTGKRVGNIATLREHEDYLPNYYINEEK